MHFYNHTTNPLLPSPTPNLSQFFWSLLQSHSPPTQPLVSHKTKPGTNLMYCGITGYETSWWWHLPSIFSHHLDKLQWDSLHNHRQHKFTTVTRDSLHIGVLQTNGSMMPTKYHLFEGNYVHNNLQAITASIKAIYILLSKSHLTRCHDPVSLNKLKGMIISYSLHILLGTLQSLGTWTLINHKPPEFIANLLQIVCSK